MSPLLKHCLLALLALCLAACGKTPLQEQQAFVFGTQVQVIVVSDQAEVGRQAIAAVLQEFDRLHRTYHAWQPSALTTLNAALATGQTQRVDAEMAAFVSEAQKLAAQGDYLFDPAIGALIRKWGFQSDEFRTTPPTDKEIADWLQHKASMADLDINGASITSRNRHVALDFGGYLKGVALDRAATILRAQGINNALINIGGNVMALGSKEGKKWRVGIQHPRQPGPLATVALEDGEAIGTSGDYQRYFEYAGKRYAHLLDPRTAQPVTHTQAVTVLIPAGAKAGTLSDATSKPIFIAGPDGWRAMAAKMGVAQVLRVDSENRIFVSEALNKRLEYLGKTPEITVIP